MRSARETWLLGFNLKTRKCHAHLMTANRKFLPVTVLDCNITLHNCIDMKRYVVDGQVTHAVVGVRLEMLQDLREPDDERRLVEPAFNWLKVGRDDFTLFFIYLLTGSVLDI